MKLTTTLKLLRKSGACVDGYNKLVRSLQELPYNNKTDSVSYIRFHHDEEINLLSILESNGVKDCAWALRATVQNSDRVARLIAVAFAREVQHLMKDERSIRALDVAERYANGEATVEELSAAKDAALAAALDALGAQAAAREAAWAALASAQDAARDAARAAAHADHDARYAAWYAARSVQDARAVKDILTAFQEKQKEIIKSFLSES